MEEKKESLWTLFITFFKIGAVTFGGGYAMLPLLQREIVEKHNWCTDADLLDYYAVGQCTPGIIAVNTSTFIGYNTRGIIGGIIATVGFVLPSFFIIAILVPILETFQNNTYVAMALSGIRVAVCALITKAVISLSKKSIVDIFTLALMVLTFVLMLLFNVSPVLFVLLGIAFGIGISVLKEKKRRDK